MRDLDVSSWSDFKTVVSNKTLLIQYYESSTNYILWAEDSCVCYQYTIWKSSWEPVESDTTQITNDRTDFENNYKTGANKKLGGHGKTTNPTAVTDGGRVNPLYDKIGKSVVSIGQVRELKVNNMITLTTTTETTLLTAGGAGVFLDLTLLAITNTANQTVRVDFRDSTGGTVKLSINMGANSSTIIPFPTSINQETANNNWTAKLGAAATDIRITATAEKNI